jgi:hypothetical protein
LAYFEPSIFEPAKKFLAQLNPADRQKVGRIIDSILCYDPYIDGRTKIPIVFAPAVFTLYRDSEYWIAYRIVRNVEIHIYNIGRAGQKPTWRGTE